MKPVNVKPKRKLTEIPPVPAGLSSNVRPINLIVLETFDPISDRLRRILVSADDNTVLLARFAGLDLNRLLEQNLERIIGNKFVPWGGQREEDFKTGILFENFFKEYSVVKLRAVYPKEGRNNHCSVQ